MTQEERRLFLIQELLLENPEYRNVSIPDKVQEQEMLLRGLMNIRAPKRIGEGFLRVQDEYLQLEIQKKGVTELTDLLQIQKGMYLWKGDITALRCDAIVNAANRGMTGCYVPNHRCIDNAIHTYAGIQLRMECADIMKRQGSEEPTGRAKITSAYNLPCRFILHTVGPIISGDLTERDCWLLASCYESCLEMAAANTLESVAFCCISTGEFGFPNRKAAEIAIGAVKGFLKNETSIKKVVFNVFKDKDREIYDKLLR